MPAQKPLRGFMHRRGIQAFFHKPHAAPFQSRARRAVQDAVAIGPADGGKPGGPIRRHNRRTGDGKRVGAGVEIQRLSHPLGRQVCCQIQMRHLGFGMHAGIGAPGGGDVRHLSAIQMRGGFFQHALDGK